MRELDPIDLTEAGVVKRIRGVAYTMRVSPLVVHFFARHV